MESADEVGVLSGASYEPLALRSHRCVSVMHCIRDVTTCIGDISISDPSVTVRVSNVREALATCCIK